MLFSNSFAPGASVLRVQFHLDLLGSSQHLLVSSSSSFKLLFSSVLPRLPCVGTYLVWMPGEVRAHTFSM